MPCNFLSGGASIFRRAKRSRASRKARVQDHGKDLDTTESALSPSCPSWRLNESRQVQECQCPARDHYPRSRSDVRDVAAVLQHRLKNVYVPHIIGQIIDSAEYWTRISVSKKQYVPVCECCPCVTYLNAGPVVGQGPSPIRKVEISLTIKDLARHVDPETSRWRWQEHDQDDQARQIEPTLCRKEVHPNTSTFVYDVTRWLGEWREMLPFLAGVKSQDSLKAALPFRTHNVHACKVEVWINHFDERA